MASKLKFTNVKLKKGGAGLLSEKELNAVARKIRKDTGSWAKKVMKNV